MTLLLLLFAPVCFAWWDNGHFIVAQIALDHLSKNNPNLVTSVNSLLADTSLFFPDQSDFLAVAPWADDLKGKGHSHLFQSWHFVNRAFVEPGFKTAPPVPVKPENNVWAVLRDCNHSLSILADEPTKFPVSSRTSRTFVAAWCMRWLIHVVGDSHQPLHVIDRYSVQTPTGDLGGNMCKIDFPNNTNIDNLHKLWDSVGGKYTTEYTFPLSEAVRGTLETQAKAVQSLYPRDSFKTFENGSMEIDGKDFQGWLNESYATGVAVAYEHGAFVCNTTVTPAYIEAVTKACEERLAIAGYRLADLFEKLVPPTYERQMPQFCDQVLDQDKALIHFTFDRNKLMIGAVVVGSILLALLLCSYCVGKRSGGAAKNRYEPL